MAYEQVLQETPYEHKSPMKQSTFLRFLLGFLSFFWTLLQGDRAIILGQTLSDRLHLRWICGKKLADETSWLYSYKEVYDGYGACSGYDLHNKKIRKLHCHVSGGKL